MTYSSRVMCKTKIKVNIKRKTSAQQTTSDLDNKDISELVALCRKYKVIIRGGPSNIINVLKKRLYGFKYKETDPTQIVGRVFIKYLYWKLGRCDLHDQCNNDVDFYTSNDIISIPICYRFYSCNEDSRQVYGYDIRSLVYYRDHGTAFRNPYTDQPFTSNELHRLDTKLRWLERLGYQTTHLQQEQDSDSTGTYSWTDRKIKQYTVNVFSALNEHQYAHHDWFTSLSFDYLKMLYQELFEIWNYRLPMQNDHKERIVKGPIFNNWENVDKYQPSMVNKLRVELLRNIDKLISDGDTEDHRKNGCYIFMLGLVLVSEDAATSHPCMYQAAYYADD